MTNEITIPAPRPLQHAGLPAIPALFTEAGPETAERVIEFFTANIRNKNTRRNYARAVGLFAAWCQERGLRLEALTPVAIAGYVEQLGQGLAKPTVKLHLAGIRMLFDYLVTGGFVRYNPASSVRGPKYTIKKGKTPVLTAEEARTLLDSIDTGKIAGLRDRALIGTMVFSFARIGAVLAMDTEDFYLQGKRWWIRLHEKGGKHHEVPAHHKAQEYLHGYLDPQPRSWGIAALFKPVREDQPGSVVIRSVQDGRAKGGFSGHQSLLASLYLTSLPEVDPIV